MTDPVLRFVTCWTKAVLTRFSSYVSTNLISEDFPVYDLSFVEKKSCGGAVCSHAFTTELYI